MAPKRLSTSTSLTRVARGLPEACRVALPHGEKLDFSNLLVPTMDSTRANYNMFHMHKQRKSVCLVGGEGTAKTSCALMFFATLDPAEMLVKRVNFSSATTPFMAQQSVEVELERGGKDFGPPEDVP